MSPQRGKAHERAGVPAEKISSLWQFHTSAHLTEAERAALNPALAAGSCPPCVTDDHFIELKKRFSDDGIIEIVSVIRQSQ